MVSIIGVTYFYTDPLVSTQDEYIAWIRATPPTQEGATYCNDVRLYGRDLSLSL
jgi:hypothetical protein